MHKKGRAIQKLFGILQCPAGSNDRILFKKFDLILKRRLLDPFPDLLFHIVSVYAYPFKREIGYALNHTLQGRLTK